MTEEEARERFFERSMPGPATQPLFDEARRLGVGFYLGYAELTGDGRGFNSAVIVGRDGGIAGRYRKIHLPGHSEHKPEAPFQHLERSSSRSATWASAPSTPMACALACACATTAAGPRPTA